GIHREHEALAIDETARGHILVELTVIGRNLVGPVVIERPAKTTDHTPGIALEVLVTKTDVEQIAREVEPADAILDVRGRAVAGGVQRIAGDQPRLEARGDDQV